MGIFKGNLLTVWLVLAYWSCFSEAAGNSQVFNLGKDLDALKYTEMMTLVLACLLAFDLALEYFEHHLLHHRRRFHKRLFAKAVKELMILGFVSFVMFILKDQAVVDEEDPVFINTYDFVNLFLFFVGISFVIAAVVLTRFTAPLKSRWDSHTKVPLKNLLKMHKGITSRPWTWYVAWPPRYFQSLRKVQVVEYHLFRSVFLRLNRKLLTPAFDFPKYASAIVDEIIIQNFDVGWASWLLAIIVFFFTLPISATEDGTVQITVHGAIIFGVVVLLMEIAVMMYINHAHNQVRQRMGVEGGFKGVGQVLKQLWVEPMHHMGQDTSAIDVKGLLAAAPVYSEVPTLKQLTATANDSAQGITQAEANFQSLRSRVGTKSNPGSTKEMASSSSVGAEMDYDRIQPCPAKGENCSGCESCDPMWLPEGAVRTCDMNGDPFVMRRLTLPRAVEDALPKQLKGFCVKVGSFWWFQTLFGMTILQKCYYTAFYFSYAIGRATESSTGYAIMWILLTPIPLLLCMLPLSKRTLPYYAQLACLQGKIVWELVSEIEEQQDIAERARDKVVEKLQEAMLDRVLVLDASSKKGAIFEGPDGPMSPRSKAMQEWFDEWDVDGNEYISKNELSEGLQKLGVFLSELELRELFRLADPDHSKTIDREEFRLFLSTLQSLETNPEHFRRELELRRLRSTRKLDAKRQSRVVEEGLVAAGAEEDVPAGTNGTSSGAARVRDGGGRGREVSGRAVAPAEDVEIGRT